MQKKLIKDYRVLILILVFAPILINFILLCSNPIAWIIPVVGKNTEWISFWGSYTASIVSVITMLYVLHKTLDDNRKKQDRDISFERNRNKLDEFKKNVLEIYSSFDFQTLITSIDYVKYNNLYLARNGLVSLNISIGDHVHMIKILCFPSEKLVEEEIKYIEKIMDFRLEFGILVDDLIIAIDILNSSMDKAYIINSLKSIDREKKDPLKYNSKERSYYNKKSKIPSMLDDISTCSDKQDINEYITRMFQNYSTEIQSIKEKKDQLVPETISIINFKENQLENSPKRLNKS